MIKSLRDSLSLLGTRRFGTFWFASLLSSIGTWAQQVAEPWLLLTLGAFSFVVGLDAFAMNAPVWFLTVAGGALADRTDRRRVRSPSSPRRHVRRMARACDDPQAVKRAQVLRLDLRPAQDLRCFACAFSAREFRRVDVPVATGEHRG